MTRRFHDRRAYLKALKMTRTDLIIFVEGKENDPIFYSPIAERYGIENGCAVEVRSALKEFGVGGKEYLLSSLAIWNQYIARYPVHCHLLLALDKDADDLLNRINPEVIYTEEHSVENYLVSTIDLATTLEKAFSLFSGDLAKFFLPNQKHYLDILATKWLDWTVYCIMLRRYPVKSLRGYSNTSKMNRPSHADVDTNICDGLFAELLTEISIPKEQFDNERHQIAEAVAANPTRYFKGKWFIQILHSMFESESKIKSAWSDCGQNGMWSAIRAAYMMPEPVYARYREEVERRFSGKKRQSSNSNHSPG